MPSCADGSGAPSPDTELQLASDDSGVCSTQVFWTGRRHLHTLNCGPGIGHCWCGVSRSLREVF